MKNLPKAIRFFGTAAAALVLAAWTCLAVQVWAHMYMPLNFSWVLGIGCAFVPGWFFNKLLTRQYSKINEDASELNSIFGMLLGCNILLVPAIYFGGAAWGGGLAVNETARYLGETMGALEKVDEATLATFPASETGAGFVWVVNVGDQERPRVIARQTNGRLKAVYLPPRGEVLEQAGSEVMVGPSTSSKSLLVPTPEGRNSKTVDVDWEGGHARFEMRPNQRRARRRARARASRRTPAPRAGVLLGPRGRLRQEDCNQSERTEVLWKGDTACARHEPSISSVRSRPPRSSPAWRSSAPRPGAGCTSTPPGPSPSPGRPPSAPPGCSTSG